MMSNENGKRRRVVRRGAITVTQDFDVDKDRYVDISPSFQMDENDHRVVGEILQLQREFIKHQKSDKKKFANMRATVRKISDVDHRVCSLSISPLVNHLPESILQLDALEVLDLSKMKQLSEIPSWINQLQNLTTLDLPSCWDCPIKALPNQIWDLTKLRALRWKSWSSKPVVSIPSSIGNMNQLEELILLGVTIVPEEIGDLQQLRVLRFVESKMIALPNSICGLQNLEVLGIESEGRLQIPHRESSFRDFLPGSIGSLKKLKKLSLRYLPYSKNEFLPSSIGELGNLEELSIDVKDAGLPNSLGKLKKLRRLTVGSGLTSIPDSIFTLTNLESFTMRVNMVELPDSFGGLENLRTLTVNSRGLASIPNSIFNLTNLEKLEFSKFNREITRLPDDIGRLVNLKHLVFIDCYIETLPDGIGNLKNLEELVLWKAHKFNRCPNAIRELRNLDTLWIITPENRLPVLSDKNEILEFGEQLASLKNIQQLDVSGFIDDKGVLSKLASQLPFLSDLSYHGSRDHNATDDKLSSALSLNRARTRIFLYQPPISLWPLIFANIRSATIPFDYSEPFRSFDSDVTFRILVDYSPSFLSGNH